MKKRKGRSDTRAAQPAAPLAAVPGAPWRLGLLAAAIAAVIAYLPAIRGEFVFDDFYLPFTAQEYASGNLVHWMAGTRPVLMLSFWANYVVSGLDPLAYHFTNILLHIAAGLLVFLVARRVLGFAGESGSRSGWLAAFASAIFLLHPLQTESVAYVASRSELLSVTLFFGAFAIFLYRRGEAVGWLASVLIIAIFGAAVTTKEHAAMLPFLLLLTDYCWNPPFSLAGAKRNWRLYGMIAAGGAAASFWVVRVLRQSDTAGFNVAGVSPYEYFLTQCRVIWLYVRLFFFPAGLNVDHEIALSRGPLDGGAIFGFAALLAAAVAAIVYRKRYALGSYGILTFFLLLAPTSSFIPILDPSAERRMYLPFIGLLFVVLEAVRRLRISRTALGCACAAICAVFAVATHARAEVWSNALSLWSDAAAKSPTKYRPNFQLAYAYYQRKQCREALPYFEVASKAAHGDEEYPLLLDWALAYDCAGNPAKAIEKLERGAAMSRNAHVYSLMGMVLGKQQKSKEALAALDTAMQLDPNFQPTYVYRGAVYASSGEFDKAAPEYRRALALKPDDTGARQGLAYVLSQMKTR